jgi:hypothetical protein
MTSTISTPSEARSTSRRHIQCAGAVLLMRPKHFGFNTETESSNRFQQRDTGLTAAAPTIARTEFDALVERLRESGVTVFAAEDCATPVCPDAIFPNNWISFHADGTVVLYPMLAPSRRRERRLDVVSQVLSQSGASLSRLLDLTHHELDGRFLEGTGSVVFDHVARIAYACRSPRTHDEPLHDLCEELGYAPCVFDALDGRGVPIYHTNVMLAVGASFAVVAGAAIAASDRDRVLSSLRESRRDVIDIDLDAVAHFAGNVLELRDRHGGGVLALSQSAARAFGADRLARLETQTGRLVIASIPTIERLGGGSVRCMLAEVFLRS